MHRPIPSVFGRWHRHRPMVKIGPSVVHYARGKNKRVTLYLFQVLIVICNFHCTKSAIASMIASHWVEQHRPSEFQKEKGQKFQEAPQMLQSSKHFLDALRTLRKPGISSAWNCILDYISLFHFLLKKMSRENDVLFFHLSLLES